MRHLIKSSAVAIFLLSVTACSGDPEAPDSDTVTETRMDEVDVLDGTISDDMVNVDAEETTDKMLEDDGTEGKSAEKQDADENAADENAADEETGNTDSESENVSDAEE